MVLIAKGCAVNEDLAGDQVMFGCAVSSEAYGYTWQILHMGSTAGLNFRDFDLEFIYDLLVLVPGRGRSDTAHSPAGRVRQHFTNFEVYRFQTWFVRKHRNNTMTAATVPSPPE